MKKIKLKDFKEFEVDTIKQKDEIDKFVNFWFETTNDFKFFTENNGEVSDYLCLDKKIDEAQNKWINDYVDSLEK